MRGFLHPIARVLRGLPRMLCPWRERPGGSVISAQTRCGFSSRHSQPCCPHGPEARMSSDWTVHPSTAGVCSLLRGPLFLRDVTPVAPGPQLVLLSPIRTPSSVPSLSCHLSRSWRLTQGYDPNIHSRGGLSPRPSYPPQPGLLHVPFATKGEDAPVVTCALHTSLLPSPLCGSSPTRSCPSEQLHEEGLLLGWLNTRSPLARQQPELTAHWALCPAEPTAVRMGSTNSP